MDQILYTFELTLLSSGYLRYHGRSLSSLVMTTKSLILGSDPYQAEVFIYNGRSLKATEVAPRHCIIFLDEDPQQTYIKSLAHSTWLNETLLPINTATKLNDRDSIQLGNPLNGGALLRFFAIHDQFASDTHHSIPVKKFQEMEIA